MTAPVTTEALVEALGESADALADIEEEIGLYDEDDTALIAQAEQGASHVE